MKYEGIPIQSKRVANVIKILSGIKLISKAGFAKQLKIIIGIVYKIESKKIIGEAPKNVNFLFLLLFIFPSLLLKMIIVSEILQPFYLHWS